ncbi:MAG: hypothetical protein PWQ22_265 [Archaeoglobaceae archaeon]|nr:hypothetical protein [Archaeoglobaceae archaeon]
MLYKKLAFVLAVVAIATILGLYHIKLENAPEASNSAPIDPKQLFLKAGQSESFRYWSHEISVEYTKDGETHLIKIVVDEKTTFIKKNTTDGPSGIYWSEEGLYFAIKPVVWEERGNERIPVFEKTWNVTEIYFETIALRGEQK